MNISKNVSEVLQLSFQIANLEHYEYVTPEVILLALCRFDEFIEAFVLSGGDIDLLESKLRGYASENLQQEDVSEPEFSVDSAEMLMTAQMAAENSGRGFMDLEHLLRGMWRLEESHAVYYMQSRNRRSGYPAESHGNDRKYRRRSFRNR